MAFGGRKSPEKSKVDMYFNSENLNKLLEISTLTLIY